MKQQEKKFNLLFTVIISIFFICLFNFSSIAVTCDLPGDFVGLMGDPTSDGKVDFNDLMVFATAYGSEIGDPNWMRSVISAATWEIPPSMARSTLMI